MNCGERMLVQTWRWVPFRNPSAKERAGAFGIVPLPPLSSPLVLCTHTPQNKKGRGGWVVLVFLRRCSAASSVDGVARECESEMASRHLVFEPFGLKPIWFVRWRTTQKRRSQQVAADGEGSGRRLTCDLRSICSVDLVGQHMRLDDDSEAS